MRSLSEPKGVTSQGIMSTSNCETDILLLASWSTLLLKTLTGLVGTTVQVFYLQIEHPTPCLMNYFFLHPILYPGLKYFTLSCKRSSRAHLTLPDLSASGVFWEMGEGSLNSPGQEPDLNSWLSGGTLLRLFLFFMGRDLSKMIKPINPSLHGFSFQPFWSPSHSFTFFSVCGH